MAESQKHGQPPRQVLESFVEYLSHPDTPYDCWFYVGDPEKTTPERVGGSKLHLMAHSVVFRRMLHESPLAEKGDIHITDIELATFRHFLRFVNGHYDVRDLSLEESVALLCVAEKYFVDHLRTRLGEHISSITNVDNVLLPMSKPECYQETNLRKAIKKIVQQETRKLVARDEFLELNTAGLLYIVTQDYLQISEAEVWKAVLAWAKHQTGSDKAEELRKRLTPCLKHIRFCTMSHQDFNEQVAVTNILTDTEIASVVKILGGASVTTVLGENTDTSQLAVSYRLDARNVFTNLQPQMPCVPRPFRFIRKKSPATNVFLFAQK